MSVHNVIANNIVEKMKCSKFLERNEDEWFQKSCIVFKSYSLLISATILCKHNNSSISPTKSAQLRGVTLINTFIKNINSLYPINYF